MTKEQRHRLKDLSVEDRIMMFALDLAHALVRWETGKGSMKSFSKQKQIFHNEVRQTLINWQEVNKENY